MLAHSVGHTAPEITAALPWRTSMRATELVDTSFNSHFAFRACTPEVARACVR